MSFDPNNAPTGSPEEVLGDDDGGDTSGDDGGSATSSGRTTASDPSDPPDPFDDGGSDSDGGSGSSDGGGDTSGTRTTAPDPSDPPDPDPSDVTRDPDPTQPDPAPDPDQQQAEGADDPDAGTGDTGGDGARTTAPDPSDPPDPDPEDVTTDPDPVTQPDTTQPDEPREFGPPVDDPPSPEEADTTPQGPLADAQEEVQRDFAEQFIGVSPRQVQTDVEQVEGQTRISGQLTDEGLAAAFAAAPSAASVTFPEEQETFAGAPMAAGSAEAAAEQRLQQRIETQAGVERGQGFTIDRDVVTEEQEEGFDELVGGTLGQFAPGLSESIQEETEPGAASFDVNLTDEGRVAIGGQVGAFADIVRGDFESIAGVDSLAEATETIRGEGIELEGGEAPTVGQQTQAILPGEPRTGIESIQQAADDVELSDLAFSGPLGFAATEPEQTQEALNELRSLSGAGVEFGMENVVDPGAEVIGDIFGARQEAATFRAGLVDEETAETRISEAGRDILRNRSAEVQAPVGVESFTEAASRGAGRGALGVTVGAPASLVTIGGTVGAGGAFAVENPELAAPAAAGFAATAAGDIAESAQERPVEFGGGLVGSSVAGAAISPIRLSRFTVPRTGPGTRLPRPTTPDVDVDAPVSTSRVQTGEIPQGPVVFGREITRDPGTDVSVGSPLRRPESTTVRGLRLRDPPIVEAVTGRADAGTTLVGARGLRPTLGAPDVDVDTIAFSQLGGMGATTEPVGAFETDVLRSSVSEAGGQAAARFRARRDLMRIGRQTEGELQLETTEEIVGEARAVPESASADVAEALEDLGATIEGSAAVRAQLDEPIRQPRDLDILVGDEQAAQTRLSEALEGETADVGDVFDIKVAGEDRPDVGEFVKGGQVAQPRLETEGGVSVTPIGEELIRKSSASGFLRGEGSPAEEFPGATGGFDIGPEPARAGERPRFKDPADAFMMGQAVAPESPAVQRFGRLFEPEITAASRGPDTVPTARPDTGGTIFGDIGTRARAGFDDFVADETARVELGGFRRSDVDVDRPRGTERVDTDDTRVAGRDTDVETSPSPGRAGSGVSPTIPGFGGSSPGVSPGGGDTDAGVPSPSGDSPGGAGVPTSPFGFTSPGGQAPSGGGFAVPESPGGGPFGSPTGGGGGGGPFGSPGGGGSPGGSPGGFGGGGGGGSGGGGGGGGTPPTQPRGLPSGGEPGDRDEEMGFTAPEGTEFFNPVATGSQLLFGDFGGGGGSDDGENPDPTGLFLG